MVPTGFEPTFVAAPLWSIEPRVKLLSGHVQPCQPTLLGLIYRLRLPSATGPCAG